MNAVQGKVGGTTTSEGDLMPEDRALPAVKCRHCGALIPLRGSPIVTCDQCGTTDDVMDRS